MPPMRWETLRMLAGTVSLNEAPHVSRCSATQSAYSACDASGRMVTSRAKSELGREAARLQGALGNRLEARILVAAERAHAAARAAHREGHENARDIDLGLRRLRAEPLDGGRHAAQHRHRVIDVDRGVCHAFLEKLPVD